MGSQSVTSVHIIIHEMCVWRYALALSDVRFITDKEDSRYRGKLVTNADKYLDKEDLITRAVNNIFTGWAIASKLCCPPSNNRVF